MKKKSLQKNLTQQFYSQYRVIMKSNHLILTFLSVVVLVCVLFIAKKKVFAQSVDLAKALKTDSGLQLVELTVGSGAEAKFGSTVNVHYTGWLFDGKNLGAKFDSSVDRGTPFQFMLGAGRVIKGWEEGVKGMKVGGKRKLIIPSELGYGTRGAGNVIPPNATLVFDVELLEVK
jgi:FKBP-type peptidyl-prolyl cis-trans isomerase FkpA